MNESTERTKPSEATRHAERAESAAAHQPDRLPTPKEQGVADKLEIESDVREHEEEMLERGAHQKGEGRLP